MKSGKISQTAWRRSVGKQFHMRRDDVSPLGKESCFGAAQTPGGTFVWADAENSGISGRIGFYAVLRAAGDAACSGAAPAGVCARILLPCGAEEEELREIAEGIEEACELLSLQAACVQGEVSPAVRYPVVSVSAAGSAFPGQRLLSGKMHPGQDIILCGYTGLEGTIQILDEAGEELAQRFNPSFLDRARGLSPQLVRPDQILSVCGGESVGNGTEEKGTDGKSAEGRKGYGVTAVRQIGSGGILAALWDLSEMSGIGFEADMHCMALKQETVEICEFFQLNPYLLTSAGSFLLAADSGDEAVRALEKAGARAGKLGVARAQNARVITSGEEVRYLDRPAPDELIRWRAGRQQEAD